MVAFGHEKFQVPTSGYWLASRNRTVQALAYIHVAPKPPNVRNLAATASSRRDNGEISFAAHVLTVRSAMFNIVFSRIDGLSPSHTQSMYFVN